MKNSIPILSALLLFSLITYYFLIDINILRLAINGYGPLSFVHLKTIGGSWENSWPGSLNTYSFSYPMLLFYWAKEYLKIEPYGLVKPFILGQIFLIFHSLYFLAQSCFRNRIFSLCFSILGFVSSLTILNVARFSYDGLVSSPMYLYYGLSSGFSIYSLGFLVKRQFLPTTIFVALAILSHALIGLYCLFGIGLFIIYDKSWIKIFKKGKIYSSFCIVTLLIILAHLIYLSSPTNVPLDISKELWMKLTRLFSSHWYPFDLGVFSEQAHYLVLPYITSLAIILYSPYKNEIFKNKITFVPLGVVAVGCMTLSILGILFSFSEIPFLIKLSLHRSSMFIGLTLSLFSFYVLYLNTISNNLMRSITSFAIILSTVFYSPGYNILLLCIYILNEVFVELKKGVNRHFFAAQLLVPIGLLFIWANQTFFNFFNASTIWAPFRYFDSNKNRDIFINGGKALIQFNPLILISISVCLLIILHLVLKKNRNLQFNFYRLLFITFFIILAFSLHLSEKRKYWLAKNGNYAQNYLDVQNWARKNTSVSSLFMNDPSKSYGWKDFSERGFFGSFKEWVYLSNIYTTQPNNKELVSDRLKKFGFELDTFENIDLKNRIEIKKEVLKQVHAKYYSLSEDDLSAISNDFGVDYAIFEKSKVSQNFLKFDVVYENSHFYVLKIMEKKGR